MIGRQPAATLLVNSSDGFDDCWSPFFHLLKTYWPRFDYPVLLNTESKDWKHKDFDVRCSRVAESEARRLTWSECLIRAIDAVETPLLLYFQEDYFINTPVRHDIVEAAIALMLAHPEIGHIALTKQGSHGPYLPSDFVGYSAINPAARYRISTQAGLWRPSVLKSYLHPDENGWMFEIFGTRRAQRRQDLFLVANFSDEAGGVAIDYTHTGIIKGAWHPDMPALFAEHGLAMDFDQRGIYREPPKLIRKLDVLKKLMQNPRHALSQI